MSKILVAYFSASGETACLAKTLAGAPAADDGSDTGTDIQQLGKGHGAFSLYRSSFHRIAPPPFLVKQVRRDCLFFRLLAVCNCQLPNFQVPLVDFCPLSHYTGTTKEGAV